jgi:protein-disulfide isomerase
MANETIQRGGANIWLALVAGLAVGFAVGREMGNRSGGGHEAEPVKVAAGAPTGSTYKSESQFPAKWLKSTDLAAVKGVSFDGMTDGQKAAALQVLNERHCECGCNMDSIADCAKRDSSCPRSPKLVKDVVDLAKQGKGLPDLYAYLDRENKGSGAAPSAPAAPAGPKKVTISAHSPRKGPKASKVTIVEFSDFQCPFCGRVTPTVKEIEEKYPKDVAVVFVNQPLPFHDKAQGAAQAFMAAARQGKAWEMHDKMFGNQQALAPTDLDKYAQEIGLNVAKFKKDFDDPKIKDLIKEDQALANSVGANGTPTFMINGREVVGAQPFAAFQTVIDEEIKKADALLKGGTRIEDVYTKLMEQAANAPPPAPPAAPAPAEKQDITVGDAPIKGAKNAPVTIVEWSDFQCPFCGRVIPTVKQIEDTYKGKVRIAFKHQPLPFHNNAEMAAEAAMAANEQGKFWEMHDKMFANQQALDRPNLEKYAQEIGLNMARFKAALDSSKFKDRIQKDSAEGMKVGANGTPTFFINGQKVEGAQPFDAFKSVIDQALAKK